jgi:hypothetical protein
VESICWRKRERCSGVIFAISDDAKDDPPGAVVRDVLNELDGWKVGALALMLGVNMGGLDSGAAGAKTRGIWEAAVELTVEATGAF